MTAELIRTLQANVESFTLQYYDCSNHKAHLQYVRQFDLMVKMNRDLAQSLSLKIDEKELKLNILVIKINQSELELVDRIKENMAELQHYHSQVIDDELTKWKREQQLSGNGAKMHSNLNNIQEWCEILSVLIWSTRIQMRNIILLNGKMIVELRQPYVDEMLNEMISEMTSLLSTLVASTFVIETQPPQVMRMNTRFEVSARLLLGGQLNVHMTIPGVTVLIISENEATLLQNSDTKVQEKKPVVCGSILNNSRSMEYDSTKKQLSVTFRNLQLHKMKVSRKKNIKSQLDEKHTLLFLTEFPVGDGELKCYAWALSLPVVVTAHGYQEPHAWATVSWDNAFRAPGRVPFTVPDTVSWGQLADILVMKFCSAIGAHLKQNDLRFLAEKMVRTTIPTSDAELNSMMVTWKQFCKDNLPQKNFTFCEWFYMVGKLTRDCLKLLWCNDLIIGFIEKNQAEEMLSSCPPGTFLLRFSDSLLGSITVAWVGENHKVSSLLPFTSRDLVIRSLPDRILELDQLRFLYPYYPKDSVFNKYSSTQQYEPLHDYVKPELVTAASLAGAHGRWDVFGKLCGIINKWSSTSASERRDNRILTSDIFEQIRAFVDHSENSDSDDCSVSTE